MLFVFRAKTKFWGRNYQLSNVLSVKHLGHYHTSRVKYLKMWLYAASNVIFNTTGEIYAAKIVQKLVSTKETENCASPYNWRKLYSVALVR
jgi:hypothetical protein